MIDRNSAKQFWAWFERNSESYFSLNGVEPEEREELLDKFLKKLHAYSSRLFFEIGGHPDGAVRELIITASGNAQYFSTAEELVAQAPEIKNWKVIALKPPAAESFVIEYGGATIDPRKAWFLPLESKANPAMLGLRVCVSGYDPSKKIEFINTAFLALDSLLGEKSTGLDVQHVEVAELPKDPVKSGLMELSKLPEYIAWRKRKI